MMSPLSRRHLLSSGAAGFGWLAFNGLFARNAAAADNPLLPRQPHFPARAKRVIFLFMSGGPSQVDTFDYKPALTKFHDTAYRGSASVGSNGRPIGRLMQSPF